MKSSDWECETKCAAYNLQIMITLFQMSFSANISINLACLFRVASCLMIDSIEGLKFQVAHSIVRSCNFDQIFSPSDFLMSRHNWVGHKLKGIHDKTRTNLVVLG